MTNNNPLLVDTYNYHLPKELIATEPANPKDSSKLLVYDRKNDTVAHTTFRNILDFIPENTNIIFNNTKVIKARIFGRKESGGKIELLLNNPLENNNFLVYIRGKVHIDSILSFDENLSAKVIKINGDGTRVVQFFHQNRQLDFIQLNTVLEKIGHVPLPPYIKREDNKEDEKNYQTVFAKNIGAVAAPTASLHFTPELFGKTTKKFNTCFITLHVGAGTFKPVESESIENHVMHKEFYDIQKVTKDIIDSDKKILAVGTTVTRTIEYYARYKKPQGYSDLFLHPNNKPIRVNHLLTNFHLPKSTLIMLVASFIGIDKTLKLYQEAIEKKYRFFSYGDAMLIM